MITESLDSQLDCLAAYLCSPFNRSQNINVRFFPKCWPYAYLTYLQRPFKVKKGPWWSWTIKKVWPWKVTVSWSNKHRANISGKIWSLYFEICFSPLLLRSLPCCLCCYSYTTMARDACEVYTKPCSLTTSENKVIFRQNVRNVLDFGQAYRANVQFYFHLILPLYLSSSSCSNILFSLSLYPRHWK